MFMEFQEGRSALEIALLLVAALGLDFAEVVHGLLELAGEPLTVQAESGEGAVGVDEIRWPRPVRPGDTLHVVATVLEARRSASKPDRGIVRSRTELTNQDGDLAMNLTAINFILARDVS